MKHKLIYYILSVGTLWITFGGCADDQKSPVSKSNAVPGPVYNVSVDNEHGKATITYALPKDEDLLYVKAAYTLASGEEREVKSSFYNNSLVVDGFGDTLTHTVQLYTVSRSEKVSPPVEVTVKPLTPPIYEVFKTLAVRSTFGGIYIEADNDFEENIAIVVLSQDTLENGTWSTYDAVYSGASMIKTSLRGMDTLDVTFGFYIRDRWLNRTDTMFASFKPLYETKLDKNIWKELILPNDMAMSTYSRKLSMIWDEGYADWGSTACSASTSEPFWFTWDMGQEAQLSRIKLWPYNECNTSNGCQYFYGWCMKEYEIWGSTNPDADGGWDNWFKLCYCDVVKPSGLPHGEENSDDVAAAQAGVEWEFPADAGAVRYVRIKVFENFEGLASEKGVTLTEVSIWGKPEE